MGVPDNAHKGVNLYRDQLVKAQEIDSSLKADDPRFRNSVLINHFDGMIFQKNAFLEIFDYRWLHVYAEHAKPLVFPVDEILNYAQFELQYPPREEKGDPDG